MITKRNGTLNRNNFCLLLSLLLLYSHLFIKYGNEGKGGG